jgi:hypothetical protein
MVQRRRSACGSRRRRLQLDELLLKIVKIL